MCLIVKNNQRILTAKKDIICYKLVEDLEDNGDLRTPFQYRSIVLGETYTSNIVRTYDGSIEKAIHSYVKLKDAKEYLLYWVATAHVVKCIIPKGSKYIRGIFGSDKSIASDTIVYTKEILGTCYRCNK